MLASTPTKDYTYPKDYVSLRNVTRDSSMSPSYRARHCTPPRIISTSSDILSYDSPMLTPSPLRQRPLFPSHFTTDLNDAEDLFLQSPYKSPAPAHSSMPQCTVKPQQITADDEEGSIFLASSSSTFSPFSPTSPSQPLRTPVKQIFRASSRSALSIKHLNSLPCPTANVAPSNAMNPATRVGVGTKRKSTPHVQSTPIRQHNLTPLMVASARDTATGGICLDRLAPLAAPKFTPGTPQTKAETDAYLKRQTATLTRLKISDIHDTGEEFAGPDNDSGCEMDEEDAAESLFTGTVRFKGKVGSLGRTSGRGLISSKGKEKEEVAEAISPGGHIVKRRARSRPLSAELIGSVQRSPSSPSKGFSITHRQRNNGIVFPSGPLFHKRSSSGSSSSDSGSPLPRRRVSNVHPHPYPPKLASDSMLPLPRPPMSRQENLSSATLFFGPSIPAPINLAPDIRSRTSTGLSTSIVAPYPSTHHSKTANRHSYAGPGSGIGTLPSWNTIQTRMASVSPKSSPPVHVGDRSGGSLDDDEDMFFSLGPQDSSFVFSVTEGTPSPRSKNSDVASLPRKFKPRDSGVVLSDDDDMMSLSGDYLNVMPAASTSVGSVHSDVEDNLVTPGFGPDTSSGWPSVFVTGTDDARGHMYSHLADEGLNVDTFIMRTLAAASKGPQECKKKVPGTPVKRMKASYLAGERPWQSAVAAKVGLRFDWETKKGKAPRKSLPAAFPALGKKGEKLSLDQSTDSEEEEDSPSGRKNKYGIGMGRPSAPSPPPEGAPLMSRTRWLMRRSSSGAFSSGSESPSSAGTPTRMKSKDWRLPMPRVPVQFSPSKSAFKLSPIRSASGSSSSSTATLNSPSISSTRRLPISVAQRPSLSTRRLSDESFSEEQPGRFERDFVEVDEVGSGEFGKVIKVRCKDGDDTEVYAVKKSKRFEGARHRLRLWEEVDILKHLSQAAFTIERNRHPNVLAYIDSWEENEALYIRTELCESGNLARFLWEYGRVFPRLDEDRVWKIIVDLSNGLRFIHDAGVIHLDLKPSNVFVTSEGRFKIGDFGMASLWPRLNQTEPGSSNGGFEREGDKLYLAPEVLQGKYSKAADVFSFGMTILEAASNIVVPDQGEAWQRLRREDFSQVDLDESPELLDIIRQMMRTDPSSRLSIHAICDHPVVSRARGIMERVYMAAKRDGTSVFAASPLASVHAGFLEEILGRRLLESGAMDVSR